MENQHKILLLSDNSNYGSIEVRTPDSSSIDYLGLIPKIDSNKALNRNTSDYIESTYPSIEYAFENNTNVSGVAVWLSTGNTNYRKWRKLSILGSNDGKSYTIILDKDMGDITHTNGYMFINFDKTYNFKYYKLEGTPSSTAFGGGLRVHVFQLFNNPLILKTVSNIQSEDSFINHGMSPQEFSKIDFSSDFIEKHYIQNQSRPFGSGKVFEQPLDVDKIIKSVKIQ